jgi:hypothetical protein
LGFWRDEKPQKAASALEQRGNSRHAASLRHAENRAAFLLKLSALSFRRNVVSRFFDAIESL